MHDYFETINGRLGSEDNGHLFRAVVINYLKEFWILRSAALAPAPCRLQLLERELANCRQIASHLRVVCL
jgi:hypothetical protein